MVTQFKYSPKWKVKSVIPNSTTGWTMNISRGILSIAVTDKTIVLYNSYSTYENLPSMSRAYFRTWHQNIFEIDKTELYPEETFQRIWWKMLRIRVHFVVFLQKLLWYLRSDRRHVGYLCNCPHNPIVAKSVFIPISVADDNHEWYIYCCTSLWPGCRLIQRVNLLNQTWRWMTRMSLMGLGREWRGW